MRLIDLIVSRTFIGKALEGGTYYLRLEMPDGTYAWKRKQKFTLEECNRMLADAEIDFINISNIFKSSLKDVAPSAQSEEEPTLWMNANDELKMTVRALVKLNEEEKIEQKVDLLKEEMKKYEVYLRVKIVN